MIDNKSSLALNHQLDNSNRMTYHPLEMDMIYPGFSNQMYLGPRIDRNGKSAYVIWIKDRIHEIPVSGNTFSSYWNLVTSNTGINMSTLTGGVIDGTTRADNERLLVWAFADEANNNFAGFGMTTFPTSSYTTLTGGTLGSSTTVNGMANARRFSLGSLVIVRNLTGTAPNYEWNYGYVTSIPSNTSIVVQLWAATNGGNSALTAGAAGTVIQLDKFRPWSGNTSSSSWEDSFYSKNYRLVGEIQTDDFTASIPRLRSFRLSTTPHVETSIDFLTDYLTLSRAVAGTSTNNIYLGRRIPPWCSDIRLGLHTNRSSWTGTFTLSSVYFGGTQVHYSSVTDNYTTGNQIQSVSVYLTQNMQLSGTLTLAGAGGTATFSAYNFGYTDGGLREL